MTGATAVLVGDLAAYSLRPPTRQRRQPDDRRSDRLRPPLEDARRALAEPDDHRPRQHDPQRRPPDPAGPVRRLSVEAAVDGRLLPARLRRPAARVRYARRPV